MTNLVFRNHPQEWRTGHDFPSVPLTIVSTEDAPDRPVAFVFFGHVNIDFDGSPTAYGPPGIVPIPDDDLQNAGDEQSGWFGVVALRPDDPAVKSGLAILDTRPEREKRGKFPVIQQAANDDPNPGYYVSSTPHASGPIYRQDSYIDASRVPFAALSGKLKSLGVMLGDYGLAIRHDADRASAFYFADVGGNNFALGECSHRVGKDLGGSGRGNSFNNNFPVSFIVFPQSGTQDPRAVVSESDEQIADAVRSRLSELSTASNASELALLMAFNQVPPPRQPQGLTRLGDFLANPAETAKPSAYDRIASALRAAGYSIDS